MALLERIQKRLVKSGGLYKLVRLLPRFSALLSIFAIVFMFTLPLDDQYRHTYISENALMPSQVHSYFRESEWNFVRGYRNELINLMNEGVMSRNAILDEWLTIMGYKTGVLNYTDPESNQIKQTLYAIYHVPKGDDTEAMVLAAPWYNEEGKYNVGAISMSLGLARYFRRLSIWAKNIIIVFPENGDEALRSWVDAYHTSSDDTGGSIESAVVLDCPSSSDFIGFVELDYSGVNGQLPNLDLVNTAVMIANNEGFKVSINNTPYGQLWTDDFFSRLTSLVSGLFSIASAGVVKRGDSKSFSGWNIQAITLRGKDGTGHDITSFGRVVDGTFRSVNNLLEKFHQSFFFYLMLGPRLFVSVGMYLPAGGLAAGAFLMASINAYVGGFDSTGDSVRKIQQGLSFSTSSLSAACLTATLTILLSVLFGLYTSGVYTDGFNFDYYTLTYVWMVIPSLALAILPVLLFPVMSFLKLSSDYTRSLSLMVLFFMGYSLVGCMVLNFPLSMIIAICSAPMCFVRYSSRPSIKRQIINSTLLFLSCPAVWLMIFGVCLKLEFQFDRVRNFVQYFDYCSLQKEIQSALDIFEETSIEQVLQGPVDLFKGLLVSYTKVQCWSWLFICFTWIPVWICMCIIGSVGVYDTVEITDEKKNQ